ncbi:MAG: G8 domain-containing protein [Lentisphaerae bacterium]|nr:G8 domain-containing protein [Lentisphaerota bacterium]
MKWFRIISGVLVFSALALIPASWRVGEAGAATVTWVTAGSSTNDWFGTNNWSSQSAPADGDEVIITNASVRVLLTNSTATLSSLLISNSATLIFSNWNTALNATNVTIASNAALTHVANTATTTNDQGGWPTNARVWIVCSNLTIAAGASINADSRGYQANPNNYTYGYGPGGGYCRGGSYGGRGSSPEHPPYGSVYGSVYAGNVYGVAAAPDQPGSAGGQYNSSYPAGNGGGAVRIQAEGTVTVNGGITVNGSAGTGCGGSGGAVWINCLRLDGTNGLISANGGNGNSSGGWPGSAGGGGRIAVIYDPNAQTSVPSVRFQAAGGASHFNFVPGIGTLYFTNNLFFTETFTHAGQWTVPGFTNLALDSLTVSNGWLGFPADGFQLTVTQRITVIGGNAKTNKLELTNAVVTCGGDLLLTNAALVLYSGATSAATLNVGGGMILTTGSAMYVYSGGQTNYPVGRDWNGLVSVTGDVTIASNAWIHSFSHSTNGGGALFRMASLAIAAGGGFNADYRGYLRGGATGYGPGGGSSSGRGGGYGGRGGGASPGGGSTYGNSNAPVHAGSGGSFQSSTLPGNGGGVIRIQASSTVTVNGALSANGQTAVGNIGGGGSGGSIYVTCRDFQCSGSLNAAGGHGTDSGGGGGGGRIAVWRIYHSGAASTDVGGGVYGAVAAEDGTLVWIQIPVPGAIVSFR